jgi:hypothetical protein
MVLYLLIAAYIFMAAVDRHKSIVFRGVLVAALIATSANYGMLSAYFRWNTEISGCREKLPTLRADRTGESALKDFAENMHAWMATTNVQRPWNVSARAKGRAILYTFRLKDPIVDIGLFQSGVSSTRQAAMKQMCSNEDKFGILMRALNAILTHTFYNSEVDDELHDKPNRLRRTVCSRFRAVIHTLL